MRIFFIGERPHEAFLSATKLLRYKDEEVLNMFASGTYRDGLSVDPTFFSPETAKENYKRATEIGKILSSIDGVKTEVITVIRPSSN